MDEGTATTPATTPGEPNDRSTRPRLRKFVGLLREPEYRALEAWADRETRTADQQATHLIRQALAAARSDATCAR
jgi:hypothetical protein